MSGNGRKAHQSAARSDARAWCLEPLLIRCLAVADQNPPRPKARSGSTGIAGNLTDQGSALRRRIPSQPDCTPVRRRYPARVAPDRHLRAPQVLRVFPRLAGIFDRPLKNAHIISAALPTAVGPSLRRCGSASGAGEKLAQCKTHHVVFPNQTSPSGTARAGPRYASFIRRSVFMCLGRVPCSRPGCCSIAQVMPPLPV